LRDEVGHLRYVHREDEIMKSELRQVIAHVRHELTVTRGSQGPGQPRVLHQ
jgi:hypothetical protein